MYLVYYFSLGVSLSWKIFKWSEDWREITRQFIEGFTDEAYKLFQSKQLNKFFFFFSPACRYQNTFILTKRIQRWKMIFKYKGSSMGRKQTRAVTFLEQIIAEQQEEASIFLHLKIPQSSKVERNFFFFFFFLFLLKLNKYYYEFIHEIIRILEAKNILLGTSIVPSKRQETNDIQS